MLPYTNNQLIFYENGNEVTYSSNNLALDEIHKMAKAPMIAANEK